MKRIKLPSRYISIDSGLGGGMGDVFKCQDTHLDRTVILKVLKEGGEERRLIDEQMALIKLRSKHVVQLFDFTEIEVDGTSRDALVLEFISGEEICHDASYNASYIMKLLWQVACGLADIHSASIIHRDIKPNNILIDENGVVKILDFGLARNEGDDALTKSIIGTPGYMAPELFRSGQISFDNKIDVYAFGVLAIDLLGLNRPDELNYFPPSEVMTFPALYSALPRTIADIIMACISIDKDKRPSMHDVKKSLEKILLQDKHNALIVMKGQQHKISSNSRKANITWGGSSSMTINYDGFSFLIESINGLAKVNNIRIVPGKILEGCSVITLERTDSPVRTFVTFDISNPEVMS
ncbi:serine/threonine-protein kinase [Pantoea stewartii]|uniref:serine/threonine-protein kinase n=1 Tax=Pantoea stewartii TaxID=66269 RepID=UPI00197E6D84|nr:serine/threonine-protein kinase [Pantoea stewartii]